MWQPLMQGEAQREGRAALELVADAFVTRAERLLAGDAVALAERELTRVPGAANDLHDARSVGLALSLIGGLAGQALFLAYLGRAGGAGASKATELAAALLDRAVEALPDADVDASLYKGLTGVAWTVEHVSAKRSDSRDGDPNEDVDEIVCEVVGETDGVECTGLIRGLVGLGVYALERLPGRAAVRALEHIVARLAERAEPVPGGGLGWPSPILGVGAPRYPLGLACGTAGVAAFLARVVAAPATPPAAPRLLDGAVQSILAQLRSDGSWRMPSSIAPGEEPEPSRLGWHGGELGVAVALCAAGQAAGKPAWHGAGVDLARHAAGRTDAYAFVLNPGLFHGACGIAHLFHRLFRSTGDPVLGAAAQRWLEAALAMRRPGKGIGGFLAASEPGEPDWVGAPGWDTDAGFLRGGAGIGLALLAAVTPVEPAWDRVLLL